MLLAKLLECILISLNLKDLDYDGLLEKVYIKENFEIFIMLKIF